MAEEVPLSSPQITEEDVAAVVRVLRSGRLSIGPLQEAFEAEVARATARRHGVACSSGTAGLHMALLALGVGPGDEVITTPFSFIASSNAILYAGATPVFVDIEPTSLNINPELIEAAITPKTKAILAVETFGNPAHMDVYRRIADKHEVWLIEDACEGLGGRWKGRPIGSWGHVGVFGFYPNKQITTGEGGMIVTDDDRVADACRSLRNQGRAPSGAWMSFERIGFNYRLSEIAAALGVTQARRLPEILEARQAVADRYVERFMVHPDLILPTIAEGTSMSWFVFVVRLSGDFVAEDRDRIIAGMHRHDVGAAAYFPCIHLQPAYRELFGFGDGAFPVAEHVAQRTIALPFSTVLSPRDQDFAASTFELMLGRETLRRD
ncbi:MAG: DegT/DnrJ/EryC1/StrS family aminotransferase [Planctomycetota bacterium]